jgi:outer membrane protein OmpA-like peptidoglycan-associated protein
MKTTVLGAGMLAGVAFAQPSVQTNPQPIYRVTVVSRNLEAVNYEHRGGPTPIDFRGTVLMPQLKGTAMVDSHRGSVSIDARLEHVEAPTRFGREYLTYVLWAISPEGRPKNLGEVLVDVSYHARLKVTTDLQAFGLMVTAEPYFSVSVPSDVVVAENVVRPDTIGAREEVTAKYELMPRGGYTLDLQPSDIQSFGGHAEKLPYDRYEALLEVYQAQNAVQIARSLGADEYAPESMSKASTLLAQAQDMDARKMDTHVIVSTAREAAQMAEDARAIAVKRRDEARRAQQAQQLQEQSELRKQAQRAEAAAEANAAAARADEEAAQARARAATAQARAVQQSFPAPSPPPPNVVVRAQSPTTAQRQLRAQLLAQLNASFATRDTPRGLVVTVTNAMFEPGSNDLRPDASLRLANVAALLSAHPALGVRVEGFADTQAISQDHAQAVRSALIARGARPDSVAAIGYGDSRPIVSNATAADREQNRRVEVVIYGNTIGNRALWDRPYPLGDEH